MRPWWGGPHRVAPAEPDEHAVLRAEPHVGQIADQVVQVCTARPSRQSVRACVRAWGWGAHPCASRTRARARACFRSASARAASRARPRAAAARCLRRVVPCCNGLRLCCNLCGWVPAGCTGLQHAAWVLQRVVSCCNVLRLCCSGTHAGSGSGVRKACAARSTQRTECSGSTSSGAYSATRGL